LDAPFLASGCTWRHPKPINRSEFSPLGKVGTEQRGPIVVLVGKAVKQTTLELTYKVVLARK